MRKVRDLMEGKQPVWSLKVVNPRTAGEARAQLVTLALMKRNTRDALDRVADMAALTAKQAELLGKFFEKNPDAEEESGEYQRDDDRWTEFHNEVYALWEKMRRVTP